MSIQNVNNDAKWHKEKALQIIQEAIDTSAESISFDGLTALEAIPHDILKLPHLKHLTCRHCFCLDDIDIILNLTELETLVFDDIRSEYETFLPQLSKLKNLRVLHIDSFDFDNENILNQLISLEKLEDFHTYSQEDSALWNVSSEEYEERYEELLQEYNFPSLFKKLHNLKSFSFTLCEYHIDKVLEVLIDMPNLRQLKICAKGSPTLLSKLTQIEELDFTEWEDLEKLPDDIGNLQNLKKLVLAPDTDTMNIGELPDSFYSLKKLEELELCSCRNITYLKDEFKNLKNLHSLYIAGSSVYNIPFSHEQLKELKELGLQGELLDFSLCKNLTSFYYYASQVGWNSIKGNYGTERNYNFQNTNIEQLSNLENIRLLGGKLTDTSFLSSLINLKNLKEALINSSRINQKGTLSPKHPSGREKRGFRLFFDAQNRLF